MFTFFNQLVTVFAELSLFRKMTMFVVLVVSIGFIGYLVHQANKTALEPLFTNLNSQDLGNILTQLDKQGVTYEVDSERKTILIPSTEVLDTRMKLAAEGLPRFGGVGFEIFDKGSFGMSEFEQRINFQRALEGELSRTIGNVGQIEKARVHLVLPEKSLFSEAKELATASVVVDLGGGGVLAQTEIKAITHLVSSAVEGLNPDQVTVVDTDGHLLTSGNQESGMMAGGHAFDQKATIEKSLERRIVELLSPVLGFGKIMARVTAQINFTQIETTDEIIDPSKTAVVSEARTTAKKTDSGSSAGGVAGAAGNLPGGAGGGGGGSSGSSDEGSENVTYEVSKTVRHQITPMGAIQSLSVAILVDGTYTEKEDGTKTYAARTPEEITKIEDLIKKAIGFDQERGDQIKVENLEFNTVEKMVTEGTWMEKKNQYGFIMNIVGNVLVVFAVLLIFFFVIRPILKSWQSAGTSLAGTGPDGVQLLEGATSKENVAQLVRSDPQSAASAIREWLK